MLAPEHIPQIPVYWILFITIKTRWPVFLGKLHIFIASWRNWNSWWICVLFLFCICRATSARYPNLTALYSIGKSVQGRDLWVMVVSSSPYEHMIGKPDVKYIGGIHGNEPVGKEMLLHLIQYLVSSYSTDPYIRWLLDNTRIHILPSMNPDGYAISKEGTCDGAQGRYWNQIVFCVTNWKETGNRFCNAKISIPDSTVAASIWTETSLIISNRTQNVSNRKLTLWKSGYPRFNSCSVDHCMAEPWSPAIHMITHLILVSIHFGIEFDTHSHLKVEFYLLICYCCQHSRSFGFSFSFSFSFVIFCVNRFSHGMARW